VLRLASVSLAAAASLAIAAPAAERHPQHDLTVTSHGKTVQATLGSHCTQRDGAMLCADSAYPLDTDERLRVHPRGRLVLRFAERPAEIDPSLRNRRSRSVHELIARGTGKRRTIRLPRRLPRGSDRLGVWVGYERGDADFEVDLKRHRHR
jgi:hypothetical protein